MRAYIIDQLAAWVPMHDIWDHVCSIEFETETDIPRLNAEIHTYAEFKNRCRKIPPVAIEEAHEIWKTRYVGIYWSEDKARIVGAGAMVDKLVTYINKQLGSGTIDIADAKLIGEFRMLLEQIRKERYGEFERQQAAHDSSKVLITNPRYLDLTPGLLMELILTFRNLIDGLHNIDFSSLNIRELEALELAVHTMKLKKIGQLPDSSTEIESSDSIDRSTES